MSADEITLTGQESVLPEAPVPNCLPETILPIPDELREPKGGIAGESEASPSVSGVRVWNHPVTTDCWDGTIGDTVTVEEDKFYEIVYFRQVPAISEATLTYIAEHKLEDVISKKWHEGILTAKELRVLSGMKLSLARALLAVLRDAQDRVDNLAAGLASSALECYWCSNPQTVVCDDDRMVKSGTYAGQKAVYSYTVPACAAKSYVSQEDADEKARQLAESMLNCFYINDPFTATCETRPDRPLEVMEPVPNDTKPIYPGRDLRVGKYTIAAGLFISYESKEEANEQAQAAAFSMLNCWYPNDEVYAECERNDEGEIMARNMWVNPKKEGPRTANIVTGDVGQMVTVPVGFFTSEYSTELATNEAEDFAVTLLECCFINEAQSLACESQQIITAAGEVVEVYPNKKYGLIEVTVDAGMFASCVSQEEANQFAVESLEGQLTCMYCNVQVDPTCVPDWVREGVHSEDEETAITLPLDYIITDGTNITTANALPPEATRGVNAGAVCNQDAQVAQLTAEAMARVPLAKADDCSVQHCSYTNDLILVTCSSQDPYYPHMETTPGIPYTRVSPDGETYVFYTKYEYGVPLGKSSSGMMKLDAGVLNSQNNENKEQVNNRALLLLQSMLYCVWENPNSIGTCGCPADTDCEDVAKSLRDPSWRLVKDRGTPRDQLTPWSRKEVVIAAGTVTSTANGEQTAFEEIRPLVIGMLNSMVVCQYFNKETKAGCAEYGVTLVEPTINDVNEQGQQGEVMPIWRHKLHAQRNQVEIPGNVFIAKTPDEADEMAIAAAKSLAQCDYDTISDLVIPEPTPEPEPEPPIPPLFPEGSPTPTPTASPTQPVPTPPVPTPQPSLECCAEFCPYYGDGSSTSGYLTPCVKLGLGGYIPTDTSEKIQQEYYINTLKQQLAQARTKINNLKAKNSL